MRLVCISKDKLNPLIQVGVVIDDLTPNGLWGSAFHIISMTDDQLGALQTIYDNTSFKESFQDITPKLPIEKTITIGGYLYCRGGKILNGTKLRANYLGEKYEAEVRNGRIWYNDKPYYSPSEAARAITHNNVNGWRWWEYYDVNINQWRILDSLKKEQTEGMAA